MSLEQTASGILTFKDPEEALKKQAYRMLKIHQDCPAVGKMAENLAVYLANYANQKRIDPKKITFGPFKWFKDGVIAFKIYHDGKAVHPVEVRL